MIAAACFVAILIVGGFFWHRSLLAYARHHAEVIAEHAKIVAAKDDTIEATEDRADVLEGDFEWARIVLADVARERDMFEAAFTAEMLRQARAELLRPDEASGLATVHEIKAGRS